MIYIILLSGIYMCGLSLSLSLSIYIYTYHIFLSNPLPSGHNQFLLCVYLTALLIYLFWFFRVYI